MSDPAEFVRARVAEIEKDAKACTAEDAGYLWMDIHPDLAWLISHDEGAGAEALPLFYLRVAEAIRCILVGIEGTISIAAVHGSVHVGDWMFRTLAGIWRDHPDYDPGWALSPA